MHHVCICTAVEHLPAPEHLLRACEDNCRQMGMSEKGDTVPACMLPKGVCKHSMEEHCLLKLQYVKKISQPLSCLMLHRQAQGMSAPCAA